MSFLRGPGSPRSTDTGTGPQPGQVELRRTVRSDRLGAGTLACPRCDAPVALGPAPVAVSIRLDCPYCGHHGPLREFLSLARPTRPTRVVVRVGLPA
jgi:predicted RNA-binding Zn-ribbon protein involved in translation (DUF1610 family)